MEQHASIVPRLRAILRNTEEISPLALVRDVVEIFQKDQSLIALPVADNGVFRGMISRKSLFFRHLSKPFAMELYGKAPIRELMECEPVIMPPLLGISSALAVLLERDPTLETDAFPVVEGEHCLGMVSVSDLMMRISQTQAELLETLNSLSARIRDEVTRAGKVQQDLLPPAEFRHGGISVSAEVITSSEIGGDFYDYFPLGKERLGLVVADVSGHGVQSGMVTTAAKASLHTLIAQGITTPASLLRCMNNAILATARQTLLMTCLIAVIDLEREELTIANAGHNFPYLCRKGSRTLEMIKEVAGFPLGFEQDCLYQEFTTRFAAGEFLFLYTDGIVECVNGEGEEFGYGRLESFLKEQMACNPRVLRQKLLEAAGRFTGGGPFEDDVTLLVAANDVIA